MPDITPNAATLLGASGQRFTLGIDAPNLGGTADCVECSVKAKASSNGSIFVTASPGGSGVWVPYIADRATYGFAVGGSGWMGTGPFSGCHIAFFTKGGRVGMAHIAKPSVAAAAAWDTFRAASDVTVLNEWKVPLPDQTRYSGSCIFLDLSDPTSVEVVQVDVHVDTMGGANGTVFKVEKLV